MVEGTVVKHPMIPRDESWPVTVKTESAERVVRPEIKARRRAHGGSIRRRRNTEIGTEGRADAFDFNVTRD